jgi:ADP-ribose pyrophosphatase
MPAEILHDGKYLRLLSKDGWEFVQRKNCCGVVGIIAVTDDHKLLLVEQFRRPLDKYVIELPAGLAGDSPTATKEDLSLAAARELEEEAGYRASRMTLLASGPSSAGQSDEVLTLFLAHNIQKIHNGGLDPTEQITVHEVPLDRVESWLIQQSALGKLTDLKIYAALHFVG